MCEFRVCVRLLEAVGLYQQVLRQLVHRPGVPVTLALWLRDLPDFVRVRRLPGQQHLHWGRDHLHLQRRIRHVRLQQQSVHQRQPLHWRLLVQAELIGLSGEARMIRAQPVAIVLILVPTLAAAQAGPCPSGQVRSADTAGHCCWPGQAWSRVRQVCVGVPECPAGLQISGETCVSGAQPAWEPPPPPSPLPPSPPPPSPPLSPPAVAAPQGPVVIVESRPQRFLIKADVGGSFRLGLGVLGFEPAVTYGGGVEAGVSLFVGFAPDLPSVNGGIWQAFRLETLGAFYGAGTFAQNGEGLIAANGTVTAGYQFLYFRHLDELDVEQKGVGFFVGLRLGYEWMDVLPDQQYASTAFVYGLAVAASFPTLKGARRRFSLGEVRIAYLMTTAGFAYWSIGGCGVF